jgi:hypothetical protein
LHLPRAIMKEKIAAAAEATKRKKKKLAVK